jgi:hypothetical protein
MLQGGLSEAPKRAPRSAVVPVLQGDYTSEAKAGAGGLSRAWLQPTHGAPGRGLPTALQAGLPTALQAGLLPTALQGGLLRGRPTAGWLPTALQGGLLRGRPTAGWVPTALQGGQSGSVVMPPAPWGAGARCFPCFRLVRAPRRHPQETRQADPVCQAGSRLAGCDGEWPVHPTTPPGGPSKQNELPIRLWSCCGGLAKPTKHYGTGDSRVIPQHSTNPAQSSLTSEF